MTSKRIGTEASNLRMNYSDNLQKLQTINGSYKPTYISTFYENCTNFNINFSFMRVRITNKKVIMRQLFHMKLLSLAPWLPVGRGSFWLAAHGAASWLPC